MTVSLTPELEKLIEEKVKSGLYPTAIEVVEEGLRLLKERDDRKEQLRADIRAGLDQVERGEYTEYDENSTKDLVEDIITRGRARLAESKKEKPA